VTKGQRLTDGGGNVVSTIELDPWGGDTSRSLNGGVQPHTFTSYERDTTGGLDEAQQRRYHGWWSRFDQPDPYDGSYDPANPQSFNRYSYVQNDPVNFADPSGLYSACIHKVMTRFLAKLARYTDQQAEGLGRYAGSEDGGADSFKYSASNPINIIKGFFGRGPSARIHFASEATLRTEKGRFNGYIASGNYQRAGFVLHSIEDVRGAHLGYDLPFGHVFNILKHALFGGTDVDHQIGDEKFRGAANEVFQLLTGNSTASLTPQQMEDLINAIMAACGKNVKRVEIVPIVASSGPTGGGGPAGGGGPGGGFGQFLWWVFAGMDFADWLDSIGRESKL
jgi:RHS repeat-associated protein